jgi:UDP-galactopyranose mutase
MYDLLIVGAGLTAATLAARLKHRKRIVVIDCRLHLGGNCFDFKSEGSFVHRYGPHIFHSPDPRITTFLAQFTQWIPYTHSVTAEVKFGDKLQYVPFPFCRQTADALSRNLDSEEIIDVFFRGYSEKMWGVPWESLPKSIRRRVTSSRHIIAINLWQCPPTDIHT